MSRQLQKNSAFIFGSVQLSMKSMPVIAYGLLLFFFSTILTLCSTHSSIHSKAKTLESAKHVIVSKTRQSMSANDWLEAHERLCNRCRISPSDDKSMPCSTLTTWWRRRRRKKKLVKISCVALSGIRFSTWRSNEQRVDGRWQKEFEWVGSDEISLEANFTHHLALHSTWFHDDNMMLAHFITPCSGANWFIAVFSFVRRQDEKSSEESSILLPVDSDYFSIPLSTSLANAKIHRQFRQ